MQQQQQQQQIPPPPADSPLSHEWFRFRLEEFIRRCDATVNHIVHGAANDEYYGNDDDADGDFSLPSTDELIGLPPSSRGTNAYARATKSLKDRLVREIRIMESTVENGFATLASIEKSLSIAKKEVRELRSILAQYSPSRGNSPGQTPRGGYNNSNTNNTNVASSGTFESQPSLALQKIPSQPIYPADVAVNISEEQNELRQLRELLQSVESQKLATKKALQAERAAFKDACDTAVKCNSVNGTQTLGR